MVISRLLRLALIADAVATAATGLLMAAFGAQPRPLLGLRVRCRVDRGGPAPVRRGGGLSRARARVPAASVWAVIVCNVLVGS